jgi:hypothetical protein
VDVGLREAVSVRSMTEPTALPQPAPVVVAPSPVVESVPVANPVPDPDPEPVQVAEPVVEPAMEPALESAPKPDPAPVAVEEEASKAPEATAELDADLAIVLGKPKKTVKPTGNLSALGGKSVLFAMEDQAADSATELSDTAALEGEYDAEKVKQAWKVLVEDLRKKNKVGLAATLANGDFQFVDPTIRFTVANEVQFEELKECSTELLHFVRTQVGNGSIALEVEVSEVEAPAEFMTPKDRYVKWASEHPSLEVIRKRLDLDIG